MNDDDLLGEDMQDAGLVFEEKEGKSDFHSCFPHGPFSTNNTEQI